MTRCEFERAYDTGDPVRVLVRVEQDRFAIVDLLKGVTECECDDKELTMCVRFKGDTEQCRYVVPLSACELGRYPKTVATLPTTGRD